MPDFTSQAHQPSEADKAAITELAQQLAADPRLQGQPPSVVLSALLSAYWHTACAVSQQELAAQGALHLGGNYIAQRMQVDLALARDAAGMVH